MSESILSSDDKDRRWSSDWDAKKDLLGSYTRNKSNLLTKDYKLAKFEPKEDELIIEMTLAAKAAYDLCPNKEIGTEILDLIMGTPDSLSILRFNRQGNMIVDRVVDYHKDKEEEDTKRTAGFFSKMLEKIKGEKRPGVLKEED